MRILYLSCHEVLEYDEVRLLHDLGHEVFSPGAYVCPENKGDQDMRPGIPGLVYDKEIMAQYHKIGAAHPGRDAKDFLTKEFVDNFDVVIVMHIPDWIRRNWHAISHKRVIWRTIGQSLASTEQSLAAYRKQGLQIVRYSPRESYIPGFLGVDALIRFYKDPNEYGPWVGNDKSVITFAQDMQGRGGHCNYDFFEAVTRRFPRKLFGPGNAQPGFGMGKVTYERLKEELCNNRVYFYTGTHPASYTLNFMESWMTGIPVVAIGPEHGNAGVWRNHRLYEIHDFIKNGVNGFISDDSATLVKNIRDLMNDDGLAKSISDAGRAEAIRHFSYEMIKASWNAFLNR